MDDFDFIEETLKTDQEQKSNCSFCGKELENKTSLCEDKDCQEMAEQLIREMI